MDCYILLEQRSAEGKYDGDLSYQWFVHSGELLLQIPLQDRVPREDGSPSHNYSLYKDPAVTLYDDGTGVSPLEGAELDYLAAITRPQTRIAQYLEQGKLKWIMALKNGDNVVFRLKQGSNAVFMPRGRIRYCGRVAGYDGVMFGVEILVSNTFYIC